MPIPRQNILRSAGVRDEVLGGIAIFAIYTSAITWATESSEDREIDLPAITG